MPSPAAPAASPSNKSRHRRSLSAVEARRLAIAAQGLNVACDAPPSTRDIRATIARQGLLQIDSVNVLVRAHYMPLYSRHGAYDTATLDAEAYRGKRRRLFEYWAHEASLVPVEMHPLFRWRMADAERGEGIYGSIAEFARERRGFVEGVLKQIREDGPLAASGIAEGGQSTKGWWGWSEGKHAIEYLFWAGHVTTRRRETAGFTRIYDLPERVLHGDVLGLPTPPREAAQRALLMHASRVLGVATAADLRDYFRLPAGDCKSRIGELVELGALLPVTVEGWPQEAYLDPAARIPRKVAANALLSPFDPLVWFRSRAERLFDFSYRIEIYTPAEKRTFGYYCLPFLMDDRIAGRIDLKADRGGCCLAVEAAHAESDATPGEVAARLAPELTRMAGWLGLERITVAGKGNLAKALKQACKASARRPFVAN